MNTTIRPPIADGLLYYDDELKLKSFVKSSIASNITEKKGSPFALITPNASYLLASSVYGATYSQLINEEYDTVIIISQAHKMSYYSIALSTSSAFETPVGMLEVDEDSNQILKKYNKDFFVDGENYHLQDHSIELQIPYLLEVLDSNTKILPILMGEPNTKFTILLSKALKYLFEKSDKKFLIIVTTNLSYEYNYDKSVIIDSNFINILKQNNPDHLSEQLALKQIIADGTGPVVSLVRLNNLLDNKEIVLLKYLSSAEITEDRSKVEGYMAGVIY